MIMMLRSLMPWPVRSAFTVLGFALAMTELMLRGSSHRHWTR